MSSSLTSKRIRGLTLIEIVVAMTVLAVVLAVGLGGVASSADSTNKMTNLDDMRRLCHTAVDRVATHLMATEKDVVITTDNGTADSIRFQENEGFDSTAGVEAVTYGGVLWYTRESDDLNLITDDGDLAVTGADERRTIVSDVTEFQVTPAENPLTSDTITISLTLERQIGTYPDGTAWTVSVTAERTIYMRDSN